MDPEKPAPRKKRKLRLSIPASQTLKDACEAKAIQEGLKMATWARRELAKAAGVPRSQA